MLIKILLVIAIVIQCVATGYALRLVRTTKYNSVWILFIVGFSLLSVERLIQLLLVSGFEIIPRWWFGYLGIVISVCLSIGVMYAHKLFKYINRLNRQRSLLNKRILTAVLRTEEKARSRFSKELHDGLGPLLSSAKMSLTALAREEHDAEQREIIDNTTYVIDEAIRSLREISNNLSPHVLNDFGLARGVQNFIDKSAAMHDVKIRFTTNLRSERYDTDIEVILYRVICELINNSLKHAACSAINLSLSQNGSELTLDYTDNGRGFNPQAMMDCGMGLSNIASRINSLGGTFDIASAKGKGMRAAIRVNTQEEPAPLNRNHNRKRRRTRSSWSTTIRFSATACGGCSNAVRRAAWSARQPAARSFWRCSAASTPMSCSWISPCRGWTGRRRPSGRWRSVPTSKSSRSRCSARRVTIRAWSKPEREAFC